MDAKSFINDYLTFTRKERIAVLIIASLIILIFFVPTFTKKSASVDIKQDTTWQAAIQTLPQRNDDSLSNDESRTILLDETARGSKNDVSFTENQLFFFDPNTATADEWKRLGIKEKTITTIQNYLAKKGTFRKPEDLKKIYGISAGQYDVLAPYIKIKKSLKEDISATHEHDESKAASQSFSNSRYALIDINNADTSMLISLPGIGSKLAVRIINFREKLGGFYSVNQVGETFGLPDSAFQKIKTRLQCGDNGIRKININSVTADELKTHPYFRWKIANALVEYRNQHGAFTSTDDLRKVNVLDDALLNKIKPYLSF